MKPADTINNLFKNSKITVGSEVDKKILNKATSALPRKAAQPDRNIWSLMMHSKITKPLAAAIVIIAGFLCLTLFNRTVPSVYAITDIPEIFRQAETIHIKG